VTNHRHVARRSQRHVLAWAITGLALADIGLTAFTPAGRTSDGQILLLAASIGLLAAVHHFARHRVDQHRRG
jgi:hypothetical protein